MQIASAPEKPPGFTTSTPAPFKNGENAYARHPHHLSLGRMVRLRHRLRNLGMVAEMSKLEPEEALAPNPCPENFVPINDGSMTDSMFLPWLNIRSMTCGPRIFYDARSGEPLTDQEILIRVFNGTTPIDPAVVPLGSSGLFLLSALILWRLIRGA